MPVPRFLLLIVLSPLLDLAVFSDFQLRETADIFRCPFRNSIPDIQNLRSLQIISEKIVENFHIHRASGADTAFRPILHDICILRRHRGTGHQLPSVFNQEILKEQHRFLQAGIKLPQEFFIFRIPVMPHNVGTQPRASHHPVRSRYVDVLGRSIRPDICIMMGREAAAAVHAAGSISAALRHAPDQAKQGQAAFGKVAAFCRPVIHFCINVNRVLGIPGRLHFLVPDSLQIQRQGVGPTSRNHQIAAELIISL